MKIRNIKISMCLLLVVVCILSGCNKKTKETSGPNESPVVTGSPSVDNNSSSTQDSLNAVPEFTIDEAVPEDVKQNIDFDAYQNQNIYELNEVETDTSAKTKLLYPSNLYMAENLDVKYHVALVTRDNGTVVLEVLGTDFIVSKNVSVIKVEWKSVGLKVTHNEKAYEFKGLCITMDEDVYFYEDVFYSPYNENRKINVKTIGE